MTDPNFDAIAHLVARTVQDGAILEVVFRCPITGKKVKSKAPMSSASVRSEGRCDGLRSTIGTYDRTWPELYDTR